MRKSTVAVGVCLAVVIAGCSSTGEEQQVQPDWTLPAPPYSAPSTPDNTTPTQVRTPPTQQDRPRTRVPEALVGSWDGDRVTLSFSRAGDVTVTPKRGGGSASGTVAIDGNSMTLYLTDGVVTISHWEIGRFDAGYGHEFFNLTLDGTSYVRDVPK